MPHTGNWQVGYDKDKEVDEVVDEDVARATSSGWCPWRVVAWGAHPDHSPPSFVTQGDGLAPGWPQTRGSNVGNPVAGKGVPHV